MKLRKATWIAAWIVFGAASIWIHYEVKVASSKRQGGGAVSQLGNIKVGEPAPEFAARDLEDREVTSAELRGRKVVLLDFWATWCGPCRMAMPSLETLQKEFKDRVEILSVNLREEREQVQRFIQKKGYTFRVVLDVDGSISDKFGVRAIPTMVVIDRSGLVQAIHVGYRGESKELRELLERLAKE
jgi:thiol-disulfide isomerase/thioredoxin